MSLFLSFLGGMAEGASKQIEKAEEGTPYFIDQYKKEIEKSLMMMVREKFDAKEYGAVVSSI